MFEKRDFIAEANKVAKENQEKTEEQKRLDLLAQNQKEIIKGLNIPNGEIDSRLAQQYENTSDDEVVHTPLFESIIGPGEDPSVLKKQLTSVARRFGLTVVGLLITLSSFGQMNKNNKGGKELNKIEQGTPESKDDLASKYEKGIKPEKIITVKKTEKGTTTDYTFAPNEKGTGVKVIQIVQERNENGTMGTARIYSNVVEGFITLSNGISGEPRVYSDNDGRKYVVYLDNQGNPAAMEIEKNDIHGIIE
jgi:hypothetical protein